MTRRVVGVSILTAGVVWLMMFPKKASLDFDMVTSVFIGLGMLVNGALVLASHRMRRSTLVLSLLLTWSIAANAHFASWARQASAVMLDLAKSSSTNSAKTGR